MGPLTRRRALGDGLPLAWSKIHPPDVWMRAAIECAGGTQRAARILRRERGLGSADASAVFKAVVDAATARAVVERHRFLFGDRGSGKAGAEARRTAALTRLDEAIGAALELCDGRAVLYRPDDGPLLEELRALRAVVRARNRVRSGSEWRRPGRLPVPSRARILAAFRRLGATKREAEYLIAKIPARPWEATG